MENLKTQIESVRDYAYKRLEDGDFDVITVYYDENIEEVRVVVEIDSYQLDFAVVVERGYMYQTTTNSEVILFYNTTKIPARILKLAKDELESLKESEIKRLKEKLKELKNQ